VSDNTSPGFNGGGILNDGHLTMTDSTVSGNSGFAGAGIFNRGQAVVANSAFSNNADSGIWSGGEGVLTLMSSTVSDNLKCGLALASIASKMVFGSVVDGYCCCDGGGRPCGTVSAGYNVQTRGSYAGWGDCSFDQPTDQVNVSADDLKLGPLQDNGGPTETHALGEGSVAIDVIPEAECVDADGEPLTADQRGFPRDSLCDIGAFEVQPF
jgi:hypothetical protein